MPERIALLRVQLADDVQRNGQARKRINMPQEVLVWGAADVQYQWFGAVERLVYPAKQGFDHRRDHRNFFRRTARMPNDVGFGGLRHRRDVRAPPHRQFEPEEPQQKTHRRVGMCQKTAVVHREYRAAARQTKCDEVYVAGDVKNVARLAGCPRNDFQTVKKAV